MPSLDMRTVVLGYAASNLVAAVVMATLWAQSRRRFAGLSFWVANFVLQFLALALVALRDVMPLLVSSTGANAMAVGGTALLQAGLQQFVGVRARQRHNVILVVAFVFLHAALVASNPDVRARTVLLSLALLALCAQCAWLLLRRVEPRLRSVTRPTGLVFLAFCVVNAVRAAVNLALPLNQDLFHAHPLDAGLFLTFPILTLVLAFSLSLMVSRRLTVDLEEDMAARRLAERALALRLSLWEFAAGHSVEELVQRALDELENLTGSAISFFRSAEEDGKAPGVRVWSTRARAGLCAAEGEGLHHPIETAGAWSAAWADAVRQRRPVIHNDDPAVPGHRGSPDGRAPGVRALVVPTLRAGKLVAVLGVGNKAEPYEESEARLVSDVADVVWAIVAQKRAEEEILRLNDSLEQLAMTDELTGLANRRAFFLRGAEEALRAKRYGSPLAVLLMDIDHFKAINDTHGHEAGDRVLQEMARVLQSSIRTIDMAARLGGEEFGILLPSTGPADAAVLAERMRRTVAATPFSVAQRTLAVTVSIGVAALDSTAPDLDALLRQADVALYDAKEQGRNRVVASG